MDSPPSSLDAILALLLARRLKIMGPITKQEYAKHYGSALTP